MEPITRRTLIMGGVGAAVVAAGGAVVLWSRTAGPGTVPAATATLPAVAADLAEPTVLRSTGGQLDVALTAAPGRVAIGGVAVDALTYNGGLPGPTLVLRPGDVLSLSLANQLHDPTNLHTHGLHVSPQGGGDNIFRRIDPGSSADYRYELPADHPPGVYWYHPHHHGMTADQVFAGLYGAIIVEDEAPIEVSAERVLVISDMTFDGSGAIAVASHNDRMNGREGTTLLVNGQAGATMTARPGARERWRIVNACTSRFLDLRLDGKGLQLLGIDSGRFETPEDVTRLRLMPGNRADVLVTMTPGDSVLRAVPVDRGSSGMMGGGSAAAVVDLVRVVVAGAAASRPAALVPGAAPRDLRDVRVDGRRTLTLGGMMGDTIDGRTFDPAVVNQYVVAGTVEEWTITNSTAMNHPFHLHVWPMQVLGVGAQAMVTPTWQDVVDVPPYASTVVRIAFEDFTGTTVYHCHILDHEDNGMMGIISVA